MREIDFLDAVGKVDKKYVEECITYKPPKKINVWIKRISAAVACFLLAIASIIAVRNINQATIIEENGFYIENGVLLKYTGDETDVTIPEAVETIADFAFLENKEATKIQIVRLGASVKKVETNAFAGLDAMTELIIDENNPNFIEEDGLVMTENRATLIKYKREGETFFKIPESIRFIAAHAVQATQLEEIDFGDSIEYIGYNAFASNFKLKAINLPDSLKYISEGAFAACYSAIDGYIPEGAEIDINAFTRVPFYNSIIAGQMCPGEEIERELITPSEAVLKSDLNTLTEQLEYLLASIRGEAVYKPDIGVSIYGMPQVPDNITLPDKINIDDLTFNDNGWDGYLQIVIPAGKCNIVLEAEFYDIYTKLYWTEAKLTIGNKYFVNALSEYEEDEITIIGDTIAITEKTEEGFYKDITFINDNIGTVRFNSSYYSIAPYVFTYSPDGTRVIAEYQETSGEFRFFVIPLTSSVTYSFDYMNGYFGEYTKGSIRWIDNENLEGINQFGRFTVNVHEVLPVIFADNPHMTDPNNTNTKEVSHNAIWHTISLEVPERWYLTNTWSNEYYYDAVECSNQRINIRADVTIEDKYFDYMCNEKSESDWAKNKNGVEYLIVEHDFIYTAVKTKEYNVIFRYEGTLICDLVISHFVNDPENYFDETIMPIIESAKVSPREVGEYEMDLTVFTSITVAEIRKHYGTLTYEYSEHGPGQPVYSIENLPGVLLVFHSWDYQVPITDDMIPNEVIITKYYDGTTHGLRIGAEITKSDIPWCDCEYSEMNGEVILKAKYGTYTITCSIGGKTLDITIDIENQQIDWNSYLQNPTGKITSIRLSSNN